MTIFDRMCGFAERYHPGLRRRLEGAALFKFDYADVRAAVAAGRSPAAMHTDFFLPFPCVVVQDDVSCILVEDTVKDAVGLEKPRLFFEYQYDLKNNLQSAASGVIVFLPPSPERGFFSGGGVTELWVVKDGRVIGPQVPEDKREELTNLTVRNTLASMEELDLLNTRDRFVVECSPKEPHKGPKIPREHQRSTYTLLTVPEIRRTLGLAAVATEDKEARAPHARRRHWRTYEDERFVNMKGQRILIPATWVGPEESVVGGRKYRVRVDL